MFFENYKNLCTSIGKTPTGVAAECGYSSSAVTNWRRGRTPHPAVLKTFADYFGVSVSDLLTEKPKKKEPVISDGLDASKNALIQDIIQLNEEDLNTYRQLLDVVLNKA